MGTFKRILRKAKDEAWDAITPSPSKWIETGKDGLPTGKLSWRGVGVMSAVIGAGSANAAFNQYQQDRLGRNMGVVTATPSYQGYVKKSGTDMSAGADGSLVFALDRNKNGGYL